MSKLSFFLLSSLLIFSLISIQSPSVASATCGPMDITIALDHSNSMASAHQNFKDGLIDLISEANFQSNNDLRLGYITFGATVNVIHPLTTDIHAVQTSIANTLIGDSRGFEVSVEAKDTAVNNLNSDPVIRPNQFGNFDIPWRSNAVKILVLITDVHPADFDGNTDSTIIGNKMHNIALQAASQDIRVSDLLVIGNDNSLFAQQAISIYSDDANTSGGVFIITDVAGRYVDDAIHYIIENCGSEGDEPFVFPEEPLHTPMFFNHTNYWPVKFHCGEIPDSVIMQSRTTGIEASPVKPGNYNTAIDVYSNQNSTIFWKTSLAFPTSTQTNPNSISILEGGTIEIDCTEIRQSVQLQLPSLYPQFLKGFIILYADDLDVAVTYTYREQFDNRPWWWFWNSNNGLGGSVDVEIIESKLALNYTGH